MRHAIQPDEAFVVIAESNRRGDEPEPDQTSAKLYLRRRCFAADEPSHIHIQRPSQRAA